MNQQTQEEAAYVADARARLQAEAAARREYDPQEAARVRSLMWDADQRIKMPRIAAEPTEIRRWAVERSARFGRSCRPSGSSATCTPRRCRSR